jgi:hypothetical protein
MYPTGDECRASARDQPWVDYDGGSGGWIFFHVPFPPKSCLFAQTVEYISKWFELSFFFQSYSLIHLIVY